MAVLEEAPARIAPNDHHVEPLMSTMARLLAAGRAPSELMHVYAAEDAHRGPNELCTCGSGRKWKHCHGGVQGG